MPVNLLYVVTLCEYLRMLHTAGWMLLFTTMKDTVTSHSSALSEHANPSGPNQTPRPQQLPSGASVVQRFAAQFWLFVINAQELLQQLHWRRETEGKNMSTQ